MCYALNLKDKQKNVAHDILGHYREGRTCGQISLVSLQDAYKHFAQLEIHSRTVMAGDRTVRRLRLQLVRP